MDSSSSFSSTNSVVTSVGSFFGKEACHVCKRAATETVKIHACKFCGKTVCGDHSLRKRDLSEQVPRARICDKCHKDIIGAGVKGERKAEMKCLKRQLEDFHRNVERRSQDLTSKRDKITEKRAELTSLQSSSEASVSSIKSQLEELSFHLQSQRQTLSHIKDAVRISQLNVKSLKESISEKRAVLETTSRDIFTLASQLPEYEKSIQRGNENLTKRVTKSEASRLLCSKCNPNFSRMMISSAIKQAKNRSMSRGHEVKSCKPCTLM